MKWYHYVLVVVVGFLLALVYVSGRKEDLTLRICDLLVYPWLFWALMVIAIWDFREFTFPEWIVYPAINGLIVYLAVKTALTISGDWAKFGYALLGGAVLGGLFALLANIPVKLKKNDQPTKVYLMGTDDIGLGVLTGILLGWPMMILALILTCLIGALIGIPLRLATILKPLQPIPFAPLMVAGTLISLLFGPSIWTWYFGLFS